MTSINVHGQEIKYPTCSIPRKAEAMQALLGLVWRKEKSQRQKWIIQEINSKTA